MWVRLPMHIVKARSPLQVLVSVYPVVVLEQERLYHRSQFHIQIEDIYCESDYEEAAACEQQVQEKFC